MKKLILALVACLGLTGCIVEDDYVAYAPSHITHGCAVIEDEYGEREVCDVDYYVSPSGIVYWDAYYGVWIGGGGYWRGGIWYRGYYPGYYGRYGGFYYGRGWYGHGYRGSYYGHHWGGGGYYHGGGGYHYHGGGGYRGGFHGGGHRR